MIHNPLVRKGEETSPARFLAALPWTEDCAIGQCLECNLSTTCPCKYASILAKEPAIRPNTHAAKLDDNVPENIKQQRLTEIIEKQQTHSLLHMKEKIGKEIKDEKEVSLSDFSWEEYEEKSIHYTDSEYAKLEKI